MEAERSTRTYTTPTCSLTVDGAPAPGTNSRSKFTLSIENLDRDPIELVTASGDVARLTYLRQVVNRYIAELVAKFPLPQTQISETIPPVELPATPAATEPNSPDFDDIDSPRSGFINKNLPGLRKKVAPSQPPSASTDRQPADRSNAPSEPAARVPIDPADSPYFAAASESAPDRHLHYLHLGNLETNAPDRVLTLSAIQLFDLAAVLDEQSGEAAKGIKTAKTSIFSREAIAAGLDASGTAAAANAQKLSNLPGTDGAKNIDWLYSRDRYRPKQSSSWLSILPWAVGTTAIVGSGLLFFDNNPNPVKDFVSKLDIPGLMSERKTPKPKPPKTATTPTAPATIAANPSTTPAPTATTPGQWQTQPVTPPVTSATTAGTNKISTAPLPNAIVPGASSQLPANLDGKMPATSSGKTPNSILPGDASAIGSTPTPSVSAPGASKPTPVPTKLPVKPTIQAKSPGSNATAIGQLPIDKPTAGKLSVSKQPISIPASPVPPIDLKPAAPIPFNPPNMGDPADTSSPKPAQSKTAAKQKPAASKPQEFSPSPQQTAQPFTPVSRNPNLIVPESAPGADTTAANPAAGGAEPTANVALNESKRYFQGKWKADATQPGALQYVIQVSGKSGIVRSVEPQGDAASEALQKSKFVKPGQKLLSPAAAGSSDSKIRVLLQPDGSVETYMEP